RITRDRARNPRVHRSPRLGTSGRLGPCRSRHLLRRAYTHRCPARPVRHPGDHPHELGRSVAADRRGSGDLPPRHHHALRALRYQLKTVPDVAEVASVGGMERAWQIVPDPAALAARGITVDRLVDAVRAANGANGGSVIEQGEAEFMVRSEGYLRTAEDFATV